MLQSNVAPNHFRCHSIPNRPHKVSVIPQLSSPQLFPQLGVPVKHLPCRHTLEYLHHSTRTVFRGRLQEQMHVIRHHFHRIYLQLVSLRNPFKDLFQPLAYLTSQYQLAIFRCPHKVILQIVYRVFGSSYRAHLAQFRGWIRLRRISAFLPPASWRVSSGGPL